MKDKETGNLIWFQNYIKKIRWGGAFGVYTFEGSLKHCDLKL